MNLDGVGQALSLRKRLVEYAVHIWRRYLSARKFLEYRLDKMSMEANVLYDGLCVNMQCNGLYTDIQHGILYTI